MENTSVSEGKTTAILSHFWIIGLIGAYILNIKKRNYFASFYIRQMIGLNIIQFLNSAIIYKFFGNSIGWGVGILLFALWIMSLLGAIKGEEKEVPFIGEHFQNWFRGI
jgi:uncharacterized membrane protein